MEHISKTPISFQDKMESIRREAMEFAGIGWWAYGFDGTIHAVDDVTFQIFELDELFDGPECLTGKNIAELVIYDTRGQLRSEVRKAGCVKDLEWRFTTLKGNDKCVVQDSYLIIDANTGLEYIQVVIHDITEQKQAEEALWESERQRAAEALRASEERYQSVLQTIEDGYYEVDLKGSFIFFNTAMCQLLGQSPENMVGFHSCPN